MNFLSQKAIPMYIILILLISLFNTGIVREAVTQTNIIYNEEYLSIYNPNRDMAVASVSDITSMKFLSKFRTLDYPLYVDREKWPLTISTIDLEYLQHRSPRKVYTMPYQILNSASLGDARHQGYLFLTSYNINYSKIKVVTNSGTPQLTEINRDVLHNNCCIVYSSRYSEILLLA